MEPQSHPDKFHSLRKLVNLPPTRHLQFPQEKLFTLPQEDDPRHQRQPSDNQFIIFEGNNDDFSEPILIPQNDEGQNEIKQKLDHIGKASANLVKEIEQSIIIYTSSDFKFVFPESKFEDVPVGHANNFSYEQKIVGEEEDTFKERLSEEQIRQIAEKGEFEVKSSLENAIVPYIWKINDTIFRGRFNIMEFWYNGLSWCSHLIIATKDNLLQAIPEQLRHIKSIPGRLFSLIFGRKKLQQVYTPDYVKEVMMDFWEDVLNNELKDKKDVIGYQLLDLFFLPFQSSLYEPLQGKDPQQTQRLLEKQRNQLAKYNIEVQKKNNLENKIVAVETKFNTDWEKLKKRILNKVMNESDEGEDIRDDGNDGDDGDEEEPLKGSLSHRDQRILNKFQAEKFTLYTAHIKQHLPKENISLPEIQALIQLIYIVSLISAKMSLKTTRIAEAKQRFENKVKKEHIIQSRSHLFMMRKVKKQFDPIAEKMEQDFYQTFMNDPSIKDNFPPNYLSIYQKYLALKKNFASLLEEKKKTTTRIYIPSRVFYSTYKLLPPYEVTHQNGYYSQKREVGMEIDTSRDFWKLRLYRMRFKSWTINCLISLVALAWVGPFGLRCLFGVQEFKYDEYVEYKNGQVHSKKRKTFIGVFNQVRDGIRKSRENFERLPDRGLLGKNISRYYNYLECYVFRLVLVGIIGSLIIYPILIVVLSIVCIVLIVTFWAWVPLIMVFCYLFNIFIFQFQSSYIPGRSLIRSIPLLSLAFVIIFGILKVLLSALAVLSAPLLSAIYIIFLALQRGFRTVTDSIMLLIFKKLGRTPSRDTAIAKKISGPGMSRNYFFSINEQDVYVLTQAALERKLFDKLCSLFQEQINVPQKRYNQIMSKALLPFGYSKPNLNAMLVNSNVNQLWHNFSIQSGQYRARYPKYPRNIRFTQEEIDGYFENSTKIVKSFVEKNEIKDWIFDEFHVLYEDYDELTRHFWISIFGCGEDIFEPLEKIDSRFKLEDIIQGSNSGKAKKSIGSVMKAFEGEVSLDHKRVKFSPAKRSLLQKDQSYMFMNLIFSSQRQNSQSRVNSGLSSPQMILYPHRNLEEVRKLNDKNREHREKAYSNYKNKIIE